MAPSSPLLGQRMCELAEVWRAERVVELGPGTGALTLSGVNTYTGATTISAGSLVLDATGTIADSSGVANGGDLTIQ